MTDHSVVTTADEVVIVVATEGIVAATGVIVVATGVIEEDVLHNHSAVVMHPSES
jgi:hypothetical protein